MEVEELLTKLENLKGYLEGLKKIEVETEKAIHKTERDIRKVCKHDNEMEYVVGTEPSYDPDEGSQRFHCEFCGVCDTLFVISEFKYMEEPRQQKYSTVGLNNWLHYSFFVDRITMRKDK